MIPKCIIVEISYNKIMKASKSFTFMAPAALREYTTSIYINIYIYISTLPLCAHLIQECTYTHFCFFLFYISSLIYCLSLLPTFFSFFCFFFFFLSSTKVFFMRLNLHDQTIQVWSLYLSLILNDYFYLKSVTSGIVSIWNE